MLWFQVWVMLIPLARYNCTALPSKSYRVLAQKTAMVCQLYSKMFLRQGSTLVQLQVLVLCTTLARRIGISTTIAWLILEEAAAKNRATIKESGLLVGL
ncbi:hypothetical protein CMUST_04920 [Corynebacterium mustelae]|uniref:Uncharacterized protein n=2 Tax=Corynebacterium mustelae TaxID=571915 RepID=A0A0G3H2J0_9CORY|nr:hypothetical protein CMUST_04920 [Corynebacterium mustelae]